MYRNYSQPWPTSGCVQKADCDSPGYADQATCCAAHYGGQTGGDCSNVIATTNQIAGKYYADYATPWPTAGCKNTLPHPIYATVFYTTQLECCKGAFGGQKSEACIKGIPTNPPTSTPSVAPTTKSNAVCLSATMLPSNAPFLFPNVKGTVNICFDDLVTNSAELKMSGVKLVDSAGNVPLAFGGGVHIHTGSSCQDTTTQGGHYWKSCGTTSTDATAFGTFPVGKGLKNDCDPWYNYPDSLIAPAGTGYNVMQFGDNMGRADSHFEFDNGYNYTSNKGKVVVIHLGTAGKNPLTEQTYGARFACGQLM